MCSGVYHITILEDLNFRNLNLLGLDVAKGDKYVLTNDPKYKLKNSKCSLYKTYGLAFISVINLKKKDFY